MARRIEKKQIIKRIFFYVFILGAFLWGASQVSWELYERVVTARHPGSSRLSFKTQHFKDNLADYDTVFLGDSRTFCAMQPDILDPLLKTRSFNLAHWSNWFPTQYAVLKDLLPSLPEETTVIWSLGHQNFDALSINQVYPIALTDIPYLASLGFSVPEMLGTVFGFSPSLALLARRQGIYAKIQRLLERPLYRSAASDEGEAQKAPAADLSLWQDAPLTGYIVPWFDDEGRLASVAQYKKNGAYLRTEIRPAYYRAKQQEMVGTHKQKDAAFPDPGNWQLFIDMLDMLKERKLNVIVNVFEEAPHMYSPDHLKEMRAFIGGDVKDAVIARGFDFVNVDFDQLPDAYYFDYNHLNSQGVTAFSSLFAAKAKAMVRP